VKDEKETTPEALAAVVDRAIEICARFVPHPRHNAEAISDIATGILVASRAVLQAMIEHDEKER
jgi:hypothetical protein